MGHLAFAAAVEAIIAGLLYRRAHDPVTEVHNPDADARQPDPAELSPERGRQSDHRGQGTGLGRSWSPAALAR